MKKVLSVVFVLACWSMVGALFVRMSWHLIEQRVHAQGSEPNPAGKLTVQVNGVTQGAEPILNFTGGNGLVWHFIDHPDTQTLEVVANFNTALIMTLSQHQGPDGANFCDATAGGLPYTCKMPSSALQSLKRGSMFLLAAAAPCGANSNGPSLGCSISIDGFMKNIKQSDGTSDPGTIGRGQQISANGGALVFFDGSIFRILVSW